MFSKRYKKLSNGTDDQKRNWNTPINSSTNNRSEMKLVPIIMDYCRLQFNALKFFFVVPLHEGLHLILIFSM